MSDNERRQDTPATPQVQGQAETPDEEPRKGVDFGWSKKLQKVHDAVRRFNEETHAEPGSEASPPASPRPPEPPGSLWGIWQVGTTRAESLGWWIERPMPFDYFSLLAFASKEDAEAVVSMTSGPEGPKTRCVPVLLGVSPAVVAQRDQAREALSKLLAASKDALDLPDVITAIQAAGSKAITAEQGRKAVDRYQAILGGLQAAIGWAEDVMEEIAPSGRETDTC
jgi:hypothetical protein